MKKEVLIAIIIGISIGAIITYGVHTARQAIQNKNNSTEEEIETPILNLTPSAGNHLLTVNSPHPDQIIEDDDIDITGITSPNSFISAVSETNQAVAVADNQGNFTVVFNLQIGANPVEVKSFHPDGQEASQEIIIVHSDTDLESTNKNPDNASNDDKNEDTTNE